MAQLEECMNSKLVAVALVPMYEKSQENKLQELFTFSGILLKMK